MPHMFRKERREEKKVWTRFHFFFREGEREMESERKAEMREGKQSGCVCLPFVPSFHYRGYRCCSRSSLLHPDA